MTSRAAFASLGEIIAKEGGEQLVYLACRAEDRPFLLQQTLLATPVLLDGGLDDCRLVTTVDEGENQVFLVSTASAVATALVPLSI